jgi:hypothetical protein
MGYKMTECGKLGLGLDLEIMVGLRVVKCYDFYFYFIMCLKFSPNFI